MGMLFVFREMEYDGIVLESWSRWVAYGVLHQPSMRNLVSVVFSFSSCLKTFYRVNLLWGTLVSIGPILNLQLFMDSAA